MSIAILASGIGDTSGATPPPLPPVGDFNEPPGLTLIYANDGSTDPANEGWFTDALWSTYNTIVADGSTVVDGRYNNLGERTTRSAPTNPTGSGFSIRVRHLLDSERTGFGGQSGVAAFDDLNQINPTDFLSTDKLQTLYYRYQMHRLGSMSHGTKTCYFGPLGANANLFMSVEANGGTYLTDQGPNNQTEYTQGFPAAGKEDQWMTVEWLLEESADGTGTGGIVTCWVDGVKIFNNTTGNPYGFSGGPVTYDLYEISSGQIYNMVDGADNDHDGVLHGGHDMLLGEYYISGLKV